MIGKAPQNQHINALTGIRAVAAYLVFWHHENPFPTNTIGYQLVHQGYIGVSLFFVLSGFLMYHRYGQAATFSVEFWRTYLRNRFTRLMPLYWLILTITFLTWTALGTQRVTWQLYWLHLTLLKGLSDTTKFDGIPQSWSLTVEWCFYLSAPVLFVLSRRVGLLTLVLILWGIGCVYWPNLPFMAFYTFLGRAFEFIAGMWLAQRWHRGRLPALSYPVGMSALLMCLCIGGQVFAQRYLHNPTGQFWTEIACYSLIFPISIVVFFVGLLRGQSVCGRILGSEAMQALGQCSYAFFLIHIGVISQGIDYLFRPPVWAKFLTLILMAHGLYQFVECPIRQFLRVQPSPSTP